MEVTIVQGQQQMFFAQLKKFADEQTFELQIADYGSNGETFKVWMSRADVLIIATNPFDRNVFRIGFYDKDPFHPASDKIIEGLFIDLKSILAKIPNVTITEEK